MQHSMGPSRVSVLALALLLAGTPGCKKEEPAADIQEAKAPSAAPSAPKAEDLIAQNAPPGSPAVLTPPPAPARPRLVLKTAGTNPTTLRYHFTPGQEKKFRIQLTIDAKVTVNGQAMPANGPTRLEVSGTTKTEKLLPEGGAERITTLQTLAPSLASVPRAAMEQLKAQFGTLAGMKIAERISDRGEVLSAEVVEIPQRNPAMDPIIQNLQDGMANAMLPLPAEPVGVGAEWSAQTSMVNGPLSVTQTSVFRVESLQGNRVVVLAEFEQSSPPRKMDPAQLPPDTQMELLAMKGKGKGKMTVDLSSLNMDSELHLEMQIDTKASAPTTPGPIVSQTANKLDIKVKIHD